jgi:hypothetical protein
MSNIQKASPQTGYIMVTTDNKVVIPDSVPLKKTDKEIFASSINFPPIRSIEDKNLIVNSIHQYINKAVSDRGANIEAEDLNYLKVSATSDIMTYYSHMTLEEIRLAIYHGVRGKFGEYFGINTITIFEWLKKFKTDMQPQVNVEAKKYLKLPEENNVEITPLETDQNTCKVLSEAYHDFKQNGNFTFYDIGNFGYKLLDRMGLILYSNEEKLDMLNKSREQHLYELRKKNRKLENQGKVFQKSDYQKMKEKILNGQDKSFEEQVKSGAMRIALSEYMKQCIDCDVDLELLLNVKLKELYPDEQ